MTEITSLPEHLLALQLLVNRCPTAEARKELIVCAGAVECISREDGSLMITANQLETA
jgi:hypothetical protein